MAVRPFPGASPRTLMRHRGRARPKARSVGLPASHMPKPCGAGFFLANFLPAPSHRARGVSEPPQAVLGFSRQTGTWQILSEIIFALEGTTARQALKGRLNSCGWLRQGMRLFNVLTKAPRTGTSCPVRCLLTDPALFEPRPGLHSSKKPLNRRWSGPFPVIGSPLPRQS